MNLLIFMISASKPCPEPWFLKHLEPLAKMNYFYDFYVFVKKPFSTMENEKDRGNMKIMFFVKVLTLAGTEKVGNPKFSGKL